MTELVLANGDIAIATLRKPAVLDELKAKYSPNQLLVVKLDVTKPQEILDAFKAAESAYGRIDIVFNNAGYGALGEVEGTPEDVARAIFDTNFWGAMNVSREAVRFFRDVNKIQGGRLLNISSMAGIGGKPGIGFYSASKNGTCCSTLASIKILNLSALLALEGATEALSKELDPKWNIKVRSGFKFVPRSCPDTRLGHHH